jgi:hypothetical protein
VGTVDKVERGSLREGLENLFHHELQFHGGKSCMEALDEDVWEEEQEVVGYRDETKDEGNDSLYEAGSEDELEWEHMEDELEREDTEDELEQEERETYLEREKIRVHLGV